MLYSTYKSLKKLNRRIFKYWYLLLMPVILSTITSIGYVEVINKNEYIASAKININKSAISDVYLNTVVQIVESNSVANLVAENLYNKSVFGPGDKPISIDEIRHGLSTHVTSFMPFVSVSFISHSGELSILIVNEVTEVAVGYGNNNIEFVSNNLTVGDYAASSNLYRDSKIATIIFSMMLGLVFGFGLLLFLTLKNGIFEVNDLVKNKQINLLYPSERSFLDLSKFLSYISAIEELNPILDKPVIGVIDFDESNALLNKSVSSVQFLNNEINVRERVSIVKFVDYASINHNYHITDDQIAKDCSTTQSKVDIYGKLKFYEVNSNAKDLKRVFLKETLPNIIEKSDFVILLFSKEMLVRSLNPFFPIIGNWVFFSNLDYKNIDNISMFVHSLSNLEESGVFLSLSD